ncbi:putative LRR receptor-like serine/threonine-protein kinase [Hordeum vulgare]|nr:putative LRR receptor-like serine/threonine-protein kinase [Hordeum vulgare]
MASPIPTHPDPIPEGEPLLSRSPPPPHTPPRRSVPPPALFVAAPCPSPPALREWDTPRAARHCAEEGPAGDLVHGSDEGVEVGQEGLGERESIGGGGGGGGGEEERAGRRVASIKKVSQTARSLGAAGFVVAVEDSYPGTKFDHVPVNIPGILITDVTKTKDLIDYYNSSTTRDWATAPLNPSAAPDPVRSAPRRRGRDPPWRPVKLTTKVLGVDREEARPRIGPGVVYLEDCWKPCLDDIHPAWLLAFRLVSFLLMASVDLLACQPVLWAIRLTKSIMNCGRLMNGDDYRYGVLVHSVPFSCVESIPNEFCRLECGAALLNVPASLTRTADTIATEDNELVLPPKSQEAAAQSLLPQTTGDSSLQYQHKRHFGRGGFGTIYKGTLQNKQDVAVKVLSAESRQGIREFLTEIDIISNVKHPNLVELIGCCVEADNRILVYEYLENSSLNRALLGSTSDPGNFTWSVRSFICIGVARGLAYLHEDIKLYSIILNSELV